MFTWTNEAGEPWSQLLRRNARKEFEQARQETDPAVIARLLFVGRDCLNQTTEKLAKAVKQIEDKSGKGPI
jgi:hypothetical protein